MPHLKMWQSCFKFYGDMFHNSQSTSFYLRSHTEKNITCLLSVLIFFSTTIHVTHQNQQQNHITQLNQHPPPTPRPATPAAFTMATTIVEDDCSHDDGDDDKDDHGGAPDFEAAARDIQNRASKPVGAASSETRHFREFFGTSLLVVDKLWWLLVENDLLPKKSRPKHLLLTLYFLKVYPKQSPGCLVVGASSGAVDPKTFKKWVWMFIENIQELVDEVVSILFNLLVLSYWQ